MRHWVYHRSENKVKIWVRNWAHSKGSFLTTSILDDIIKL